MDTPKTAIIIGQIDTCRLIEQQLDLLCPRPISLGWVLTDPTVAAPDAPVLGSLADLESILVRRRPAAAIVCLPAVMSTQITAIRTRLRKAGVPDRFMPTLADQLAGVGPRTHFEIDLNSLLNRPTRRIDHAAVESLLHGKRVLITGAGGSIGSELVRMAARYQPSELLLVERSENALFEIDRQIARTCPEQTRRALLHDVVDARSTLALFRKHRPDVIFHAAAHKHVPMMEDHPAAAVDNNLFGTRSVVDAAVAVNAERFVMISTDKAVNPSSIMGATKRLAELYVQDVNRRSETCCCMVRFGNVLGSSGSVLDVWSRQIADGGPITVTDPRMTRYFMTIPEAAALVLQSAALVDPESESGEVFLLNMGDPINIAELAQRFVSLHGLTPRARSAKTAEAPAQHGSIDIVFTGVRPGEKLHEELAFDAEAMRPTRHPDINIWMLAEPNPHHVQRLIAELSPEGRPRDPAAVAAAVRGLVPEMVQPVAA